MGFRAEVREYITKQNNERQVIGLLLSEIADLRKVNKDLMDRLMAKNFEELKLYQASEESGIVSLTSQNLELDEDDGNAGEIL